MQTVSSHNQAGVTHSDLVRDSVFFDVLSLLGVKLRETDVESLKKHFSDPSNP